MRRFLAALLLVAAPAFGQNVETKRVSAETKRVDGSSSGGSSIPASCVTAGMIPFLGTPTSLGLTCHAGFAYDPVTDTLGLPTAGVLKFGATEGLSRTVDGYLLATGAVAGMTGVEALAFRSATSQPFGFQIGWGAGGKLVVGSTFKIEWRDTNVDNGAPALGLERGATGALHVTDGTTGTKPIRQALATGEYREIGQATELLTLSTAGTTTDTTTDLPANAVIEAVVARIATTITTATDWQVGDATTPGRFIATNATMTAGEAVVGLVHIDQTGAAGPRQTTAAKVRVTTTGTPGAGAIRLTWFYRIYSPPSS